MMLELPFQQRVVCLLAGINDLVPFDIDPLEDASLGTVAPRRRHEFHAGRQLARMAMSRAGLEGATIEKRSDRLPQWPRNVVGCISHTETHVAAAITVDPAIAGLGLDVETAGRVEAELYPQILVAQERVKVESGEIDATRYFCAKEAIFKAAFAIHHEYFEFTDVLVEMRGQSFSAKPCGNNLRSRQSIARGEGYSLRHEQLVVSLFVVRS